MTTINTRVDSHHHKKKRIRVILFKTTIMNPLENLHYAIGELAYSVARADGEIQKEEKKKFHDLVEAELRNKEFNFNVSDIIFQLMERDKFDSETTYNWAMKEIKLNSHYLSPQLKEKFICVMQKVAEAFPPVTKGEQAIIEKFKEEIKDIQGDPVYYDNK